MSGQRRSSNQPRGITRRSSGKYRVSVTTRSGGKETVTRVFSTLELAKIALAEASAAREAGGDVRGALGAVRERDVGSVERGGHMAGDDPTLATQPDGANGCGPSVGGDPTAVPPADTLTANEVFDEWEVYRKEVLETSDPKRAGNRKSGPASLRPGTVRNNGNYLKNHLRPELGDLPVHELTTRRLQELMTTLARKGLAVGTQDQILMLVRQIFGSESGSRRPSDHPWLRVRPIQPAEPLRLPTDPTKWGGRPGSAPPVVPMRDVCHLAQRQYAADRAVTYLMDFAGLRRGEVHGLNLGSFTLVANQNDDDLWQVKVVQQRDLLTANVLPYVKSDASHRTVVLAPTLFRYLVCYVERYHCLDLRNVAARHSKRALVMNPAGRGIDGGFLEARPSSWASRWNELYKAHGYSHEERGFFFAPHHLRKSLSTYLLNARTIVTAIMEARLGPRPADDEPEALIAWLDEQLVAKNSSAGFFSADVSSYLGHQLVLDDDEDDLPASPITLGHYNLTEVGEGNRQIAIARTIDLILRYELDDGDLPDRPDPRDAYPVLFTTDAHWIEIQEAAAIIGLSATRLNQCVHEGEFLGQLMWRADGGHLRNVGADGDRDANTPAIPVQAVLRKDVDQRATRHHDLGPKKAGQLLGVSPDVVLKQCDPAELELYRSHGGLPKIPPAAVERMLHKLHDLVIAALDPGEAMTVERIRRRIEWQKAPLGRNSLPKAAWVEHWLGQLCAAGVVRATGGGRYQLNPKGSRTRAPKVR